MTQINDRWAKFIFCLQNPAYRPAFSLNFDVMAGGLPVFTMLSSLKNNNSLRIKRSLFHSKVKSPFATISLVKEKKKSIPRTVSLIISAIAILLGVWALIKAFFYLL